MFWGDVIILKLKRILLSFWAFIIYFVIICAIVISVRMGQLKEKLAEYEFLRPETITTKVEQYFKEGNIEALRALPTKHENFNGDNFDEYLDAILDDEYFESMVDGDTLYSFSASTDDDTLTYDYISNNKKLASLTLKKVGSTDTYKIPVLHISFNMFGSDIYEIESIEWHPKFSYTVTVPEECNVYVNGKLAKLTNGELVSSNEPYEAFGAKKRSVYKYTLDDYSYVNDVAIEPLNDSLVFELTENKHADGADYVITSSMCEEMKAELEARTREAVPAYIYYTALNSYHVSTVLPYVHPDAELYQDLKNFNNTWNDSRVSDEFTKFEISEFEYYDDMHASLRADVMYRIYKWDGSSEDHDFKFRLHYVKEADGIWYLVYNERIIA